MLKELFLHGRKALAILTVISMILASSVVLFGTNTVQAAVQATYYVSPNGSDSNNGTSPSTPFATITKARDVVRTINGNMSGDILIYIMAGNYYINSTINFTNIDSGTNGYDVIYRNYDSPGSAHFIGGQQVTGWSQYSGNIYRAYVGTGWTFNTLYENGVRARKARYPNYSHNSSFPLANAAYLTSEGVSGSNTELQYKSGDLNPSGWNLNDVQVVVWPGGYRAWRTHTIPVQSINTSTRRITLSEGCRYSLYDSGYGSRYYVQGDYSMLDQAGEFYLDKSAGYLYYWAMDGAIGSQTIIAPKVKTIISLKGASESSRAHNIQFDGLALECTEFTDFYRFAWLNAGDSGESHSYPDYDREILMPKDRVGAFYLENTDNVAIKNCHIKNIGYTGIYAHFYNQYDTFYGNWIEHVGLNGIMLQGRYPGEGDVSKNNLISNCKIQDIGELCGDAAGVQIKSSGSNEVSYCEIFNSVRYAVAWDGLQGPQASELYLADNIYKYLKIYNCNQDSGDTGSVSAYGTGTGTVYNTSTVEQVTIDNAYAHPSMIDYAPNGIFMDELSHGQQFINVKVTNSQGDAFRTNLSGGHTFTNVSWQTGFNDSSMDYANIGLKSDFVYGDSGGGGGDLLSSSTYESTTFDYPGEPGTSLHDDNTSTAGSKSAGSAYITYNFGSVKTIDYARICGDGGGSYYSDTWTLQRWDGSSWVDVFTNRPCKNEGVWFTEDFTNVSTQRIKIIVNGNPSGGTACYELEVIEAGGGSPTPTPTPSSTPTPTPTPIPGAGGDLLSSSTYESTTFDYPGEPGTNLHDNNTSTAGSKSASSAYIIYDFGSTKTIDYARICSDGGGSYYSDTWTLQRWDGSSWVDVFTNRPCKNEGVWFTEDFTNVSTQRVKIIVNGNPSGGTACYELEVIEAGSPVGGTIGYTSILSSDDYGADNIMMNRHQASSNMTVTEMKIYLTSGAAGNIKLAIYSDNGGEPGNLLRTTNEGTNLSSGWNTLSLTSSLGLTSGTYYWLAVWTNTNTYQWGFESGGTFRYRTGSTYGTWPNPIGSMESLSYKMNIYAQ